jgi:hypothetical protein
LVSISGRCATAFPACLETVFLYFGRRFAAAGERVSAPAVPAKITGGD